MLFVGLSAPLFWTFGDVYPGFQSHGGCLTCVFCHLHTVDSSDSPLVRHLLTSLQPAMQRILFYPHTWLQKTITNHILLFISISFRYREDLCTIYIQTVLTNILSPLYLVNLTKNAHMNTKQNIAVGTCLTGILNLFQVSFSFLFFYKLKNQRLVSDILHHTY